MPTRHQKCGHLADAFGSTSTNHSTSGASGRTTRTMTTKLLALAALIGPGIGPNALVDARNIFADGPPPHANGRGREASPAVLKGKGLLRAGINNINADNLPCKNPNLSCHVPVVDGDEELDVELEPHSVRGKGYKLLVQGEDGELSEVDPGPDTTFRGNVAGDPGSAVAASITAAGVLMEIFTSSGDRIVLEPAGGAAEVEGDHVVYHAEDVEPTPDKLCGAMAPWSGARSRRTRRVKLTRETTERKLQQTLYVAELSIDADFEYFLAYDSDVDAVKNRVESVINAMNLQYEGDVGITHEITTTIVRTSSSQPYTSTDASTLLDQFRNEWNAKQDLRRTQRDVAQ
ncbi:hypothetical protein ACHAXT_007236 [Thalassiosira profunda]